jgi:hypothetical protein
MEKPLGASAGGAAVSEASAATGCGAPPAGSAGRGASVTGFDSALASSIEAGVILSCFGVVAALGSEASAGIAAAGDVGATIGAASKSNVTRCGLRNASKELSATGRGSMKPRKRRASADSGSKVVMRAELDASVIPPSRLSAKRGALLRLTSRTCLARRDDTFTRLADLRSEAASESTRAARSRSHFF